MKQLINRPSILDVFPDSTIKHASSNMSIEQTSATVSVKQVTPLAKNKKN